MPLLLPVLLASLGLAQASLGLRGCTADGVFRRYAETWLGRAADGRSGEEIPFLLTCRYDYTVAQAACYVPSHKAIVSLRRSATFSEGDDEVQAYCGRDPSTRRLFLSLQRLPSPGCVDESDRRRAFGDEWVVANRSLLVRCARSLGTGQGFRLEELRCVDRELSVDLGPGEERTRGDSDFLCAVFSQRGRTSLRLIRRPLAGKPLTLHTAKDQSHGVVVRDPLSPGARAAVVGGRACFNGTTAIRVGDKWLSQDGSRVYLCAAAKEGSARPASKLLGCLTPQRRLLKPGAVAGSGGSFVRCAKVGRSVLLEELAVEGELLCRLASETTEELAQRNAAILEQNRALVERASGPRDRQAFQAAFKRLSGGVKEEDAQAAAMEKNAYTQALLRTASPETSPGKLCYALDCSQPDTCKKGRRGVAFSRRCQEGDACQGVFQRRLESPLQGRREDEVTKAEVLKRRMGPKWWLNIHRINEKENRQVERKYRLSEARKASRNAAARRSYKEEVQRYEANLMEFQS